MPRSEKMDIDYAEDIEPQQEKPPSHPERMDIDDAGYKNGKGFF